MVIWLVVPFAGVELVETVELVIGDTMLEVVPLAGTLKLEEVVAGIEEVLVHPPEQLVIVLVLVV